MLTCWDCENENIKKEDIVNRKLAGGCLGAHYYGICPNCHKDTMFRNIWINAKGKELERLDREGLL
jgi:hypothetical protein